MRESFAKIIHEFGDAGMLGQVLSKNRFRVWGFLRHAPICTLTKDLASFCVPNLFDLITTTPTQQPVALTIAGSDSSAGAGIQADLKTFSALGVYGTTAITAIVAEVPGEVSAIQSISSKSLQSQIQSVMNTFPVNHGKTGMLANRENVEVVAEFLSENKGFALVVDPVFRASAGAELLSSDGVATLKDSVLPLAALATPNLPESEILLGTSIKSEHDLQAAPRQLFEKYGSSFLVKGGHFQSSSDDLVDFWCLSGIDGECRHPRLPVSDTHGTGCTLSAAITAFLAHGLPMDEAIAKGTRFLASTLSSRLEWDTPAGSIAALNHFPNGVDFPDT